MRNAVVTFVLLVGAVLGLAATPAGANSAHSTRYTFWTIQHNIAGGLLFRGGPAAIKYVEYEMGVLRRSPRAGRVPDLVTLEEVCFNQYRAFKAAHPNWSVVFTPMITRQASCGDWDHKNGFDAQGQVLASPWPLVTLGGTPRVYRTNLGHEVVMDGSSDPSRPGRIKYFTLLCADLSVRPDPDSAARKVVHACVTHLRASGGELANAIRFQQTKIIKQVVNDYVHRTNRAVVLSGDFNDFPGSREMSPLYKLTSGPMREADQRDRKYFSSYCVLKKKTDCRSGDYTLPEGQEKQPHIRWKLDYAFYSANRAKGALSGMSRYTGLATPCQATDPPAVAPCSDHRLLRARATLFF